ncbi:MAG: hypothetical protein ACJAZ8_002559 [Planctomycetota bacterium]|jgi:hypothetical protein
MSLPTLDLVATSCFQSTDPIASPVEADQLAAIGYLRQGKSQAMIHLGLVDESGAAIRVGGQPLLQIVDPITYRLVVDNGYEE